MAQRLRLTFATGGPMRYVSHLDTMRTWERTIRRARLPLAYTQGFSPHPRIALAAPLPVGVEGERELMDLWLDEPVTPADAARALNDAAPPGLEVVAVEEVDERLPSLQSQLASARYRVGLASTGLADTGGDGIAKRIEALLALDELDWEEQRGDKVRRYDLRATIIDLTLDEDGATVRMHLSLEEGRTGRPAQVLRALDLDGGVPEIVRTEVALRDPSEAKPERAAAGRASSGEPA
jgi:radical SAM-linked protein